MRNHKIHKLRERSVCRDVTFIAIRHRNKLRGQVDVDRGHTLSLGQIGLLVTARTTVGVFADAAGRKGKFR